MLFAPWNAEAAMLCDEQKKTLVIHVDTFNHSIQLVFVWLTFLDDVTITVYSLSMGIVLASSFCLSCFCRTQEQSQHQKQTLSNFIFIHFFFSLSSLFTLVFCVLFASHRIFKGITIERPLCVNLFLFTTLLFNSKHSKIFNQ